MGLPRMQGGGLFRLYGHKGNSSLRCRLIFCRTVPRIEHANKYTSFAFPLVERSLYGLGAAKYNL